MLDGKAADASNNLDADDRASRGDFHPGGLSRREVRRKLLHMLPGAIPFVMMIGSHEDPLPWWNLGLFIPLVLCLVILGIRYPQNVRRVQGEDWLRTCLTYAIPPIVVLVAFRGNAEFASVVLCVLAFGDSAAGLAGPWLGGRRLPWNRAKTWIGLLAFVVAAAPMATLAYWGEARPGVPFATALACGGVAAVCGAVAESLPVRWDDNLRVSTAAAIGVILTSFWLVSA